MTLKDFREKVKTVQEKLQAVAMCNPSLDLSKVSYYLKNVNDVLRNYQNDYHAGRYQTLAGFREMALFNFGRAEQILFEATEVTVKALRENFLEKAHGRIPKELLKAVLLQIDEVYRVEGFASAKQLLDRASNTFNFQSYDDRIVDLSWIARVKVPTRIEKPKPLSRTEFLKRPLGVKLGKVSSQKEANPTPQPQPKPKVFTGRFVDPNASSVSMNCRS